MCAGHSQQLAKRTRQTTHCLGRPKPDQMTGRGCPAGAGCRSDLRMGAMLRTFATTPSQTVYPKRRLLLTYVSFWLEVTKPDDPQAKDLAHDLPDPPSGRFGPYDLKNWAIRESLEIDYVDNCWLRVPVQRTQLIEFFNEVYGQEAEVPLAIVAAMPVEWALTLVAEEF